MRNRFFFCLAVGLLAAGLARAEDPQVTESSVPWKAGEKLTFQVGYGILPAGEGVLEVRELVDLELSTQSKRTARSWHFVATAKSNSFVDAFYKVRDRNEAWLDAARWMSHRFEQHNQEGKYILDQFVEFDWKAMRFRNQENVQGRAPKIEEGELAVPAVDTLSSLYLTRMKNLEVGQEVTLNVHSGRNYPLVVKVIKREKVKVKAGAFDCFLVEPFLLERGIFIQKGKKLQVWLTADQRKMPVKMKAEIYIGQVFAELIKIEP